MSPKPFASFYQWMIEYTEMAEREARRIIRELLRKLGKKQTISLPASTGSNE